MAKTKSKAHEDGEALKKFTEFMSSNGEDNAIIGLRLEEGKLEVDCSIGHDDSESNPSCCYANSVSEAVNESMRLYDAFRPYFQKQKDEAKKFYDEVNKKK